MPTTTRRHLVALRFQDEALLALDQTALPWRTTELRLEDADQVAAAIGRLAIRGAPLIGVAAGYGVALELSRDPSSAALERACRTLIAARPTAVNLAHAVDRVRAAAMSASEAERASAALEAASAIHAEEEAASDAMAGHGADFLVGARRLLTHCNTGALAAPGRGTALGVVAELWDRGHLEHIMCTETRPLLQGARLTAFELHALGIPHTLIVDSAAAGLLAAGAADGVIVGCDRVAANGDVANKVGTYALALAARAAGIPFVVVGPTSTIDAACPNGVDIEIEERSPEEVRGFGRAAAAPDHTQVRNPAFDVTPANLVSALVTERGVATPVSTESVATLLARTARPEPVEAPHR